MSNLINSTSRFRRQRGWAHWLACSLAVAMPLSAAVIAQDEPSVYPAPDSVVVVGNQTFPVEIFRCKTCGLIHSLPNNAAMQSESATAWDLPADPANRSSSRFVATTADGTSNNLVTTPQASAPPATFAPGALPSRPAPVAETKDSKRAVPESSAATRNVRPTPQRPSSPRIYSGPPVAMPPHLMPPGIPTGPTAFYPVPANPPQQIQPASRDTEGQVESALSSPIGKRLLQLIEENAQLKARTGSQTEVMNAQLSAVNQRAAELQMRLAQKDAEQQRRERAEQDFRGLAAPGLERPEPQRREPERREIVQREIEIREAPRRESEGRGPDRPDMERRGENDIEAGDRLIAREIAELRETLARTSQQDRESLEHMVNELRQLLMRGGPQFGRGPFPGFQPLQERSQSRPGMDNDMPRGERPEAGNRSRPPLDRDQGSPGQAGRPQRDDGPGNRGPGYRVPTNTDQPRDRGSADRREDGRESEDRRPSGNREQPRSPDARRDDDAGRTERPDANNRDQAERRSAEAERQRAEAERQRVTEYRERANREQQQRLESKQEANEAGKLELEVLRSHARSQQGLVAGYKAKMTEMEQLINLVRKQLESRSDELAKAKEGQAQALARLKEVEARLGKDANEDDDPRVKKSNDRSDEDRRKHDSPKEKRKGEVKSEDKIEL